MSVREAIRSTRMDINVPDSEVSWVGPFDSFPDCYRIARLERFDDLHTLGLVPPDLTEDAAAEAMRADELSFRAARETTEGQRGRCCCQENLRADMPRRPTHENLANAMRSSFTRSLSADDPEVLQANHHLIRWFGKSGAYLIGVASTEDVFVGFDSTLVMSPTVHALHARKIHLSDGSRLRFESGSVSVKCEELNGPQEPTLGAGSTHGPGLWPPRERPNVLDPNTHLRSFSVGKHLPGY